VLVCSLLLWAAPGSSPCWLEKWEPSSLQSEAEAIPLALGLASHIGGANRLRGTGARFPRALLIARLPQDYNINETLQSYYTVRERLNRQVKGI